MIEEDHCVYLKRSKKSFVILSLYAHDILIARNDMSLINAACDWLFSNFDMKNMGKANYILGVRIVRNRLKMFLGLSQDAYIQRIF